MAYVACGRLDANLEEGSWHNNTGPKIWDFAGGKLLVEEAGGVTRDISRYRGGSENDKNDQERAADEKKNSELDLLGRSVFSAASHALADALVDTITSA